MNPAHAGDNCNLRNRRRVLLLSVIVTSSLFARRQVCHSRLEAVQSFLDIEDANKRNDESISHGIFILVSIFNIFYSID